MKKQLLTSTLAVAVMAGAAVPAFAADGLSASAGVASAYLWRGIDLGDGSAAVSGDVHYSMAGAYGGVWASSGDASWGSEYDLYAGYGMEFGGVGIDLSVWNYNYSDNGPDGQGLGEQDDSFGDLSDVVLAVSFAGVTAKYYDAIAGGLGEYYTLSYSTHGFTGLVGHADQAGYENPAVNPENYTHVDLTYSYNENLSFTVSKVVSPSDDANNDLGSDNDANFVVAYSLPIK
jgi:uncharacterized protein (TIGR02001 family)